MISGNFALSRISLCIFWSRELLSVLPLVASRIITPPAFPVAGIEMNLAALELEHAVDGVERGGEREIDLRRGGIEIDDYLLRAQSWGKHEGRHAASAAA